MKDSTRYGWASLVLLGVLFALGGSTGLAAGSPPTALALLAPAASTPPACGLAWRVVTSPNPNPANTNQLFAVAALAADDVWAVGNYDDPVSRYPRTLVVHWDGLSWSVVPSPNAGNRTNILIGLVARAPDDVWAVGYYDPTGIPARTLVLHWDGTAWSVVPSPNANTGSNYLYAVSALAPDDVWAVGYYGGGWLQTLTMHWDGTAWSVVPSPNSDPQVNELVGVAAVAPDDVWAVGGYGNNADYTLIEHWDGTSWTAVPVLDPATGGPLRLRLRDVAAISATDIWAVGSDSGLTGILHWDGTAWTVVPSPSPGSSTNRLDAVTARAANDVWAVGYFINTNQAPGETLVLHWDGAAWTQIPSPSPGLFNNGLEGVSVVTKADVWAVGDLMNCLCTAKTLILHYSDPCGTPSPTPAPSLTPVPAPTATGTASPTPCAISFSDVDQNHPFYPFIRCLACRQIVSGYADRTFRPGNDVTRGQLSKILANAAHLQHGIPSTQQTFTDVPATNAFWLFVERLAATGAISGYGCGGGGEPCDPRQRPYFRWGANATRGQISKITAVTAGWNGPIPPGQQTFADVPSLNPFWTWIEELASRGIISGYICGGPGEPCDPQQRPYFRWGANTTRGQMSKIAAQTFFPGCQTPARR